MPIENARIKEVFLGIEDHGIPAVCVTVEQGNVVQGYGSFDLRGMEFGKMLTALLRVCGAREWGNLKGKYVRVDRGDEDVLIRRIGHIVNEDFLDIKQFYPLNSGTHPK